MDICLWGNDGELGWKTMCGESYSEAQKGEVDGMDVCPFCGNEFITTRPVSYYDDMEDDEEDL